MVVQGIAQSPLVILLDMLLSVVLSLLAMRLGQTLMSVYSMKGSKSRPCSQAKGTEHSLGVILVMGGGTSLHLTPLLSSNECLLCEQAQVVEMDPSGTLPLLHTQKQGLARDVGVGKHVLVNSGENVSAWA
jgi:hypothetical protein